MSRDRKRIKFREWRKGGKYKEWLGEWHKGPKYKEWLLARQLNKYGLTIPQYEKMLETQKGLCALCGTAPKKVRLAIDHNHRTERVRGLFCVTCNRHIIGNLESKGITVEKLSDYLKGDS